jgi:hypothetical protein
MSKCTFFSPILILSGFLTVFTTQVKAVNYVVVSTANSGSGSLEAAIDQANSNSGADTIVFNIANAVPVTIDLFSALPEITETLTIDGTSEPGYAGTPLITIDTSNLLTPGVAFTTAPGVDLTVDAINVVPAAASVPEPSSACLLSLGLAGAAFLVIRRNRTQESSVRATP